MLAGPLRHGGARTVVSYRGPPPRESVTRVSLPGPFLRREAQVKILDILFGPEHLLKINWSELQEKSEFAVRLWSRRNLSVLLLPYTTLVALVRLLFLSGRKVAELLREICYLHHSECGLFMPSFENRTYASYHVRR